MRWGSCGRWDLKMRIGIHGEFFDMSYWQANLLLFVLMID